MAALCILEGFLSKNFRSSMKKYLCILCGFIYDEAKGLPDDGIPAGTHWENIPDDWFCPDCGVTKSEFEMVEIAA